ncbi:MAG TPA: nuclear transport factor 2 family protein [Ignavibacteriaceae bacterium]|nr:nuclear transport factor 2 family protein [Ignavibacteriaceae bacterium]
MKAKIIIILVIPAFMLLLAAGCLSQQKETVFDLENAKKEIDAANSDFINLFNRSDSVGLANLFTVDGKSMEPNAPALIGRSQIQAHYSAVMKAGANKIGLLTTGLWGDENMLAEEGEFTFTDKDGKLLDKGKYLTLWKAEDGKWKLFRDCYNSDLPLSK